MTATARFGRFALVTATAAGLAVGAVSLVLARRADTASWAGRQAPADILLVLAGWSLIAAGVRLLNRPADRAAGALLVTGGFAWFAADWNNQFTRSPALFTAGIVFGTVTPVLIGHAALRYDGRRLRLFDRVAVRIGYLGTVVLAGLVPALFFDPAVQQCAECTTNMLAVQSIPALVGSFGRIAVLIGPLWCGLLILAIGWRFVVATPGQRRLDRPVQTAAIGYLIAVGTSYLLAFGSTFLPAGTATRTLWAAQGCLLLVMALGTWWPALQRRLTRARVAQLVVAIAAAPPIGGLSSMLSPSLRDPSFRVLYPQSDGALIDAGGRPASPAADQAVTQVVRSGRAVAVLTHRPGLLDDPDLVAEITAAARLVLDNERLQAQTRAKLADLQASRDRIVRTGDAERRRLERDLHDGAQQLLVSLALALSLEIIRRADDPPAAQRMSRARTQVTAALVELRTLARGIYPRELADEGLAAALETLAEGSPVPLTIKAVPLGRFPHAVEAAAYQLVARIIKNGDGVTITASAEGDQLRIDATTQKAPRDLAFLEDRVGSLGGQFTLQRNQSGSTTMKAVLPCGS